jgi:hypothetical protein
MTFVCSSVTNVNRVGGHVLSRDRPSGLRDRPAEFPLGIDNIVRQTGINPQSENEDEYDQYQWSDKEGVGSDNEHRSLSR